MEQEQKQAERDEEFLTPAEVAAELRISLSATYALIRNGNIEAVNLAANLHVRGRGLYRIKRKWLNEFVARRSVVAAPELARVQCHVRRARHSEPVIPRYIRL